MFREPIFKDGLKKTKTFLIKNLVSWCFEPSQPQRLRTNFSLSPSSYLKKKKISLVILKMGLPNQDQYDCVKLCGGYLHATT